MKRRGIGRESLVGKLLSVVIISFLVLYIIPSWKPSLFSAVILFLGVGLIADTVARFLVGKNEWPILIPAALTTVALALLFTFFPLG